MEWRRNEKGNGLAIVDQKPPNGSPPTPPTRRIVPVLIVVVGVLLTVFDTGAHGDKGFKQGRMVMGLLIVVWGLCTLLLAFDRGQRGCQAKIRFKLYSVLFISEDNINEK